jgi:hypothetical protein
MQLLRSIRLLFCTSVDTTNSQNLNKLIGFALKTYLCLIITIIQYSVLLTTDFNDALSVRVASR